MSKHDRKFLVAVMGFLYGIMGFWMVPQYFFENIQIGFYLLGTSLLLLYNFVELFRV